MIRAVCQWCVASALLTGGLVVTTGAEVRHQLADEA